MGDRVWERRRSEAREYRRREPRRSGLYRIVYQERERLEREWESRFQERYGCLRREVLGTLDKYLNCGILAHGCARAVCESRSCGQSILIPFSCKKRICPSCAAKRALIFGDHLHEEVLAKVPHRHLVLSLPKRLRGFFRYDRRLNKILFKAGWRSVRELFEAILPGRPGAVLVLQTAGESLNFNPHLHCCVTE